MNLGELFVEMAETLQEITNQLQFTNQVSDKARERIKVVLLAVAEQKREWREMVNKSN